MGYWWLTYDYRQDKYFARSRQELNNLRFSSISVCFVIFILIDNNENASITLKSYPLSSNDSVINSL